jgi:predicted RNase H-like nuclease
MAVSRFLGVDLAWSEGRDGRSSNESGVAVLDLAGRVLDAGWTRGIAETVEWIKPQAGAESALLFVDAPLVVSNATGQRPCERQVGQRYGRWKVSANSTNLHSPRLAGIALRKRLEDLIDALLCAWTAALWARHGPTRCQVLGQQGVGPGSPYATIVAPARPEQRR